MSVGVWSLVFLGFLASILDDYNERRWRRGASA